MAENAYQKKFRADLEAIDPDAYFEPRVTLQATKENYDGATLSAEDIESIARGDFEDVFRRDPEWTELPSGQGWVWRSR